MWWGSDDSASFFRTLDEMRDLIESVSFHARVWDQITTNISLTQDPSDLGQTIQTIVMGDDLPAIELANKRNHDERRTVKSASGVRTPLTLVSRSRSEHLACRHVHETNLWRFRTVGTFRFAGSHVNEPCENESERREMQIIWLLEFDLHEGELEVGCAEHIMLGSSLSKVRRANDEVCHCLAL